MAFRSEVIPGLKTAFKTGSCKVTDVATALNRRGAEASRTFHLTVVPSDGNDPFVNTV